MASVTCPSCQQSFTADAETGEKVRCPKCRREFTYTGDFKRKLILAVSLSAAAIALIVVVIVFGSGESKDEAGRNKTQELINAKSKMAVPLQKAP